MNNSSNEIFDIHQDPFDLLSSKGTIKTQEKIIQEEQKIQSSLSDALANNDQWDFL
ncbi:MAG: hypothetical protein ACD_80C00145G0008 [uncultured bacterium (gcode 4)]|uniref:Uncharacterized protein n=1 Tax=uncultured bacterium (gcode 4) TaxID=1234023 RepID=K1YHM6_9BACT|nr:MAG: hypothetical protein ACD_80C00145G0008 [uncultured bacterium (gcode 4)]